MVLFSLKGFRSCYVDLELLSNRPQELRDIFQECDVGHTHDAALS